MKHIIIGTAGHVDHGKTALVKALTQIDCDSHKAEKDRGITINLGFAHIDLPNGNSIGIIDVPGHKDFIDTMVSGACGIDLAMMVIAADSGIMPQTIEHLNILESLNVKKGIIVVSRIDLVDDDFIELVNLEIMERFEGTFLENAPIIPVSSVTGKGIENLISKIEELSSEVKEKTSTGNFRLFIDRIFNIKGFGIIVTGSVLNGSINAGDNVFLLPDKPKSLKIRSIQRHGKTVDSVKAGDRAAINIAGIKQTNFEKGMILSNAPLDGVTMIDASIKLFDTKSSLKIWSNVVFNFGTYKSQARIHLINKDVISSGETAIAQIHLNQPAILFNNDRFIIRNTSGDITLGSGIVIDIEPLHHRKRTLKLIDNLTELVEATAGNLTLLSLVKIELRKQSQPFYIIDIAKTLKTQAQIITETCLHEENNVIELYKDDDNDIIIDTVLNQTYHNNIINLLIDYSKKYPILNEGLNTKEIFGKLKLNKTQIEKTYLDLLLKRLESSNKIKFINGKWILSTHKVFIDNKMAENIEWLEKTLLSYDMQKPVISDIEAKAKEQGLRKDMLNMILKYLNQTKKLYFTDNEYIHSSIVDKCRKEILTEMIKSGRGLNEGDFRKIISGTKKIVIPLIKIYISEGILTQKENIIYITPKGENLIL